MWEPIHKSDEQRAAANADNYARLCRDFTWDAARGWLSGLPAGGLNIAHEAVDRHVAAGRGDVVALRYVARDGSVFDTTYAELSAATNRFANVLSSLGVDSGDRVFSLMGPEPALYIAALGTLKHTSVYAPLFAAFGPDPIKERLSRGRARVLITTPELYERRISPIRDQLPTLDHVFVVGDGAAPDGTTRFTEALAQGGTEFRIPPTNPDHMALLHFTSGTTGRPKGAVHVHEAVVAHHATARLALDLRPDDVFWCTADPGWVTGTSYGIIAPLTVGATVIADAGEFDARRWYQILQDQRVTVWYTAPTALRMLMRHPELAKEYDLSALRHIASVGEPLNPEAVVFGQEVLGQPVHDTWWQTETGAIMISNFPAVDIRPGSMGLPVPGIEVALLVHHDEEEPRPRDAVEIIDAPDTVGELAVRSGWPSMFRGYLDEPARTLAVFSDGWYRTGDLARRDADGYLWFVGRADDVIKSAGHLIGPFEVESVLMEHPAVAEAGVIGKPDPVAGEIVKAFVRLRADAEPTNELRLELLAFARRRLGGMAPKEIDFATELPYTRSGKVMRRLLKARELGLAEGDVSTLETVS